jgi:hypothetical protein
VSHGRVYKARGNPIIFISLAPHHSGNTTYKHTSHTKPPQEVGYYASQSGPNLPKIAYLSLFLSRAPSTNHRATISNTVLPKSTTRVSLGVRSDTRHRQLARQVGGVSLIKVNSMAVTFKNKITLSPGAMFRFGSISCIADEEGTLHRVADPPKKKPSSGILREARASPRTTPPLIAQGKMVPCRPGFRSPREKKDRSVGVSLTQKTLLSTLPTKEWTRITRKKEINILSHGRRTNQATFSIPLPSKEDGQKNTVVPAPFYPDILFIHGRLESAPISNDGPTMQGEEPPQHDARRRRNRRRNVWRHHEAAERGPALPVSQDKASEVGETLDGRVH